MAKGLVLIIVATLGLVAVTMLYLNHHIDKLRRERADQDLSADYVGYREGTKSRMTGYGWVDSATVHVPIEMAQERVLKRYGASSKQAAK